MHFINISRGFEDSWPVASVPNGTVFEVINGYLYVNGVHFHFLPGEAWVMTCAKWAVQFQRANAEGPQPTNDRPEEPQTINTPL